MLFEQAVDLPTAERDLLFSHQCSDDPALLREVQELLAAHESRGLLDVPHDEPDASFASSLIPGTCLGPWRVDVLIGRGGMGEVYSAWRADGAFNQRVALKLLRSEADIHGVRFHAERNILARLEHPGIARLLDGGTTPQGRPYTVMEFVEGRTIVDYCNVRGASLTERLTLFCQVCEAVAFAHRNLVIHRDLKPANILVDTNGTMKLLDFGIAKLLDIAETQASDTTVAPFTPDYAAPEQLNGEPVTTATDIYALGVLLFELLTGERPWRSGNLPYVQVAKRMLDRAPPSPSRIASNRAESPVAARLLVGDLDAIVAKCLRPEPALRYETVSGLKRDVERHLHNEPVLAREGAGAYVLGRFARRHRWAMAVVAALILALAVGLAGTTWQARRAATQAARATAALDFVEALFDGADPAVAKGAAITARDLLDRGAQRVDREFAGQPALRAQLKHTIGTLYLKLGLLDRAREELDAALELTPVRGPDELRFARLLDRARIDVAVGTADHGLARLDEAARLESGLADPIRADIALSRLRAELLAQRGDDAEAIAAAAHGFAAATAAFGTDQPDTLEAGEAYASQLVEAGHGREALPLAENAARQREAQNGRDDPATLNALDTLANVLKEVDQLPRASALADDVLERRTRVLGADHPDTAKSDFQVSQMRYREGRYADARVFGQRAVDVLRRHDPTDRSLLAAVLHENATIDYEMDHRDDAVRGYRESSALLSELYGPDHREVVRAQVVLAMALRHRNQMDEAIGLLRRVEQVRAALGRETPERVESLRTLGDTEVAMHDAAAGVNDLEAAERMALHLFGEDHEKTQKTRLLLGRAYFEAGKTEQARDVTQRALDGLEKAHPQGHPDVATAKGYLARIELANGDTHRAEQLSREEYEFERQLYPDPANSRVAETQGLLGECLMANGKRDEGRRALQNALAVIESAQPTNRHLSVWRNLLTDTPQPGVAP
jgi:tetratricopeptide (TPR) repeat protein